MRYLTPRKRAEGKGAAHAGAEHHWHMIVSSAGLALIVPTFLYIFGSMPSAASYGGAGAAVASRVVAILFALVIVVGMQHFRRAPR